jgi:tRNA(adenine34) deaminase
MGDEAFLDRVYEMALEAERRGNLPIAALLAQGSRVISVGANETLTPVFHPGRHAEVAAVQAAPESIWESAHELTIYTSLEPCVMCFGTLILHRIGRVVFGAFDTRGGALSLREHLPPFVRDKAAAIRWEGPVQRERFDPLAQRALVMHWRV